MRKEIVGILLFFLLVFVLVSLVSYHPQDPSLNNATTGSQIENLFGKVGSYFADALIGLFGLGAFWVPLLLLFMSIQFFSDRPPLDFGLTLTGGLLLILTSAALLAYQQDHYVLFGNRFSSGGWIGIHLKKGLFRYTNPAGGSIILSLVWLVGFILMTGFSLMRFGEKCRAMVLKIVDQIKTAYLKRKERHTKAQKRQDRLKRQTTRKAPEIKIKAPKPKVMKPAPAPKQDVFAFMKKDGGFQLPPVSYLEEPDHTPVSADDENLRMLSKLLEKKLEDFNVRGNVVAVSPGPVITTFEYAPAAGVKINKIVTLADDLALTLRATSVRIVAPIPGKAVIGIEIPNQERETVRIREVIVSPAFEKSRSKLTICLGNVAHPFFRQQFIAPLHLAYGPEQSVGGFFNIGHHRRDQVRNPVVHGQLDAFGVHHNHFHIIRGGFIQKTADHRVEGHTFASARCSGNQQMGHFFQFSHHRVSDDVFTQTNGQFGA